jgi:DNA-binding IclR family transcriptional regulator
MVGQNVAADVAEKESHMAPPPTSAVKSARRALEVLEHFDRIQKPQSLTDISAALGYPPSSTLALLKSLHTLEYLSFNFEDKTYSPTMRVAMLGAWVQRWMFCDGLLINLMEQLQRDTGETMILGMQNDLHVQYIHVVQSHHSLRYHLHPGTLRPIQQTAAGIMLLTTLSQDAIARLVREMNSRGGRQVSLNELQRELNEARGRGFAFTENRVTEGAGTIAMLTPKTADGRRTVVGVAGPLARLRPNFDQIVDAMRRRLREHSGTG